MIKFPENPKKHLCGVFCNLGQAFCSFTKTNTPPQIMQSVPNPKQGTFSVCFGLFFPSFPKNRIFLDM